RGSRGASPTRARTRRAPTYCSSYRLLWIFLERSRAASSILVKAVSRAPSSPIGHRRGAAAPPYCRIESISGFLYHRPRVRVANREGPMAGGNDELYRRLFRMALLIRLVEERVVALYPSDRIQSPVHLSIGQEAVAVGVCDALRPDDLVFATYRSHGFYIAKGGRLDAMFAELYGRKDGISGGKAGSMHPAAPE